MKKIFIVFTLLLVVFGATSCAKKEKAPKKVTLILATQDTSNNPTSVGLQKFAEKLAEISDGTMTVEFVTMTKYASVPEMFEAMTAGTFDMAAAGYTEIRFAVPELGILGYILKDFEHLQRVMASPFGQKLYNMMYDAGFVAAPPIYIGARRVTSNKPIYKVADFQGLKYRTTPTGTGFATRMGADFYPIAWSELPKALAEGVVDAQDNPLSLIESAELYKWQTHIAMTEHSFSTSGVFLRREKYDTFTAQQQMWYNEAIAYGIEICNDIVVENEANILEKFVNEYGMTVTYPDLDEIRSRMEPDYDYAIELFGEDFVNEGRSIE